MTNYEKYLDMKKDYEESSNAYDKNYEIFQEGLQEHLREEADKYKEIHRDKHTSLIKESNRLDKLYDELEKMEESLLECEHCQKHVEKYNKEALESGFKVCDACAAGLERCEHCGSIGEYGANWRVNGIHDCPVCEQQYCDNCEKPCDCDPYAEDEDDDD